MLVQRRKVSMNDATPDEGRSGSDETANPRSAEPMSAAATVPLGIAEPSDEAKRSVVGWLPWLVVGIVLFALYGVLRVTMPDVFGAPGDSTNSPSPTISVAPTAPVK
jgi:hypothetical protein